MMHTRVVSDNGLTTTAGGLSVDVRLPWYRSLPLSVVEIKEVAIDGQRINSESIRLQLNNQTMRLSELRPLTSEWWYVLDSGHLQVEHAPISKGSRHEVAVTIAVRPPYFRGFARIVRTCKSLVAN